MKVLDFFHRLSLKGRLQLSFGSVLALIALSAIGVMLLFSNTHKLVEEKDQILQKALFIREFQLHTANVWQFVTDAALTQQESSLDAADNELVLAKKNLAEAITLSTNETEISQLRRLESSVSDVLEIGKEMFSEYRIAKESGDRTMERLDVSGSEILKVLNPMIDQTLEANKAKLDEVTSAFQNAIYYSGIGIGGIVILMLIALRKITNYITRSFRKMIELFRKISIGDFSARINGINDHDEFGTVMWEINEMVDQIEAVLKEVITSVKYSSEGKFFRKPMSAGLKGMLRDSAEEVSASIVQTEKLTLLTNYEKEYLAHNVDIMLNAINQFSQGDLTIQLEAEKDDEIGKLFSGFNAAIQNISDLIMQVADAVEATASASTQISSSSEEMAAGAQEQSTQTSDIAASVEEMTKTILETTQNSSKAAEAAKNSGTIANEGGKVVYQTIEGMNHIAEVVKKSAETVHALGKGSDQIGEIVQVINDIADQTNLLALNAAIEAARAGEQGRGFAVVADEVRKLAERTTKATKEIGVMIKQIQTDTNGAVESMMEGTSEVEKGKTLAGKAGSALKEIIVGAEQVVDMSTQVAAASEQQSRAAEQISKNIETISGVTHESAIGVQQIARAAEDLNQLTVKLQELTSRFKVDNSLLSRSKNKLQFKQAKGNTAVCSNGALVKR